MLNQPVDLVLLELTYLPFKDVTNICQSNKQIHSFCTNNKYKNKWKNIIDNTYNKIPNYQDKLQEVWAKLNLPLETYNYIIYTRLIDVFDPITQLMIYYRQKDFESFNLKKYNKKQQFLALFLLKEKSVINDYSTDDDVYNSFILL